MPLEQLDALEERIRNRDTPLEEIAGSVRQAIGLLVAEQQQARAGHVEGNGALEAILRADRVMIDRVVRFRQSFLETIRHLEAEDRALTDAEMALQNWALDMIEHRGQADLEPRLKAFMAARAKRRNERAEPLRRLADEILHLQQALTAAAGRSGQSGAEQVQEESEKYQAVDAIMRAAEVQGVPLSRDHVTQYLFTADPQALEALREQTRQAKKGQGIVNLVVDAQPMLHELPSLKAVRDMEQRVAFWKAMAATKVVTGEGCGFDQLCKDPANHRSAIDLLTTMGAHSHLYIDEHGQPRALQGEIPERYPEHEPVRVHQLEQDKDEVHMPLAHPIYIHRYEQDEVVDALRRLPDGAGMACSVLVDGRWQPVHLEKRDGSLVYQEDVPGAPSVDKLLKQPLRYMNPVSLTFER